MSIQAELFGEPVGLLDNFEKGLERVVNGVFAKTFQSGIQPVEIASALRREIDTNAAIVSRDRILAPNHFTVELNDQDYERLQKLGDSLSEELHTQLAKHARAQGYSFASPLTIEIEPTDKLPIGTVNVASSSTEGEVTWMAVLEVEGRQHTIRAARTSIGRGSGADVVIGDAGSSRRHAEILWDGKRAMLRDLGSTNGTKVNGVRTPEAPLSNDSVITIGRTDLVFRIAASAKGATTQGSKVTTAHE